MVQYKNHLPTIINWRLYQNLEILPTVVEFWKVLVDAASQTLEVMIEINAYFLFLTLPSNELMLKVYPQIIPMHVSMEDEDFNSTTKMEFVDAKEHFYIEGKQFFTSH